MIRVDHDRQCAAIAVVSAAVATTLLERKFK
jgi:hypothetical protein